VHRGIPDNERHFYAAAAIDAVSAVFLIAPSKMTVKHMAHVYEPPGADPHPRFVITQRTGDLDSAGFDSLRQFRHGDNLLTLLD
jgi:hypothetical protein